MFFFLRDERGRGKGRKKEEEEEKKKRKGLGERDRETGGKSESKRLSGFSWGSQAVLNNKT